MRIEDGQIRRRIGLGECGIDAQEITAMKRRQWEGPALRS
jgi:hypothetical protein